MKKEDFKKRVELFFPALLLALSGVLIFYPGLSLAFTGGVDTTLKVVKEVPPNQAKVCRDVTCSNPPPAIIDFNKKSDSPLVIDSVLGLSGKVWGGDLGWIIFNPPFGGVRFADLSTGRLTGTAWSQTSGIINFDVTGQQVVIDPKTGEWRGWAWASGPYGGWIKFDCEDREACVRSTWRGNSGNTPGQNGAAPGTVPSLPVMPNPAPSPSPAPSAAPAPMNTVPPVPSETEQKKALPVIISGILDDLANGAGKLGSGAGKYFNGAVSGMSYGAQSFAEGFSAGWKYLMQDLGGFVKDTLKTFEGPTSAVVNARFSLSVKPVSDGLSGAASAINGAGSAISGMFNGIGSVISSGASDTVSSINGAGSAISGMFNGIGSVMSSSALGAARGMNEAGDAIFEIFRDARDGVSQTANVYWSGISESGEKIAAVAVDFAQDFSNGARQIGSLISK